MANDDIRDFYFYQEYSWQPADFVNMQKWEKFFAQLISEGIIGKGVVSGLKVAPLSGMDVRVEPGIAINENGFPIYVSQNEDVTLSSPSGDPARSLVVLRPKETDVSQINEPLNPTNQVPLHKKLEYEVVVLDGTPSANPVYPSTQSGDVVLMGFELSAGHSTVQISDLAVTQRDHETQRPQQIRKYSSDFNLEDDDKLIEVDVSGGAASGTLPDPLDNLGREYTCVKVDSSSNAFSLIQNSTELISGQPSWDLTSQWESIKVYSNGENWRIL